jgi:hypothetical protein
VGNILRRHGIPPAPETEREHDLERLQAQLAVLTGADFFTVEVLTWREVWWLTTFCSSCISEEWMAQMGRNAINETSA